MFFGDGAGLRQVEIEIFIGVSNIHCCTTENIRRTNQTWKPNLLTELFCRLLTTLITNQSMWAGRHYRHAPLVEKRLQTFLCSASKLNQENILQRPSTLSTLAVGSEDQQYPAYERTCNGSPQCQYCLVTCPELWPEHIHTRYSLQ